MKFIFVIVLVTIMRICNSANILVIAPFGGKSHYILIESLIKGLLIRGHEIDVVSNFASKISSPRYKFINIQGSAPIYLKNLTLDGVNKWSLYESFNAIVGVAGYNLCEGVLNNKIIRDLRNSTKKYDLLIVHYFGSNCFLGFAHLFSIPTVAIITSVNLPWASFHIGLPDNPSYIPTYFSPYVPEMTFIERLTNSLIYVGTNIGFSLTSSRQSDIIAKKFFGPQLPNTEDLARNINFVMVNSHFSINQPRPAVPNFLEIAGIHIDGNTTLSTYFQDSLKTDKEGIIFLSFGSMLLTETMSEDRLKAFFGAFQKLPYKIMWRAAREKFPKNVNIPDNIQFETWMPQLGILCHPNVKLFISHGGMLSLSEAIYCGTPILGIPVFADQDLNIRQAVGKGIAIGLHFDEITEDNLIASIKLLTENPRYKANVEKMSELFRDRPAPILDTAVYWIEYIIRHKGAPHLKTMGANLPWYQYFLLDVIASLIIFVLIIIFSFYKLILYIFFHINVLIANKIKKE